MQNRQVILVRRPNGLPANEDFAIVSRAVAELGRGQVLVQVLYVSVDPYMRGRMRDQESYAPPFELHQLVGGGGVGRVTESRDPRFAEGDYVVGPLGWQEYALVGADAIEAVDPSTRPLSAALGVLGMPGLTAYFGVTEVAHVQKGDRVVVSGAAGAVGMTAVQIAKLQGAVVVGIAGTDEKVRVLEQELGIDAAINYHHSEWAEALHQACPEGIDVYFDNVGGPITDRVFEQLRVHARVAVCGSISGYNDESPRVIPDIFWRLVSRRIRVEGFLVGDFGDRRAAALQQLRSWYSAGHLAAREHTVRGFENIPDAFLGLFRGDNIGKLVVQIAD